MTNIALERFDFEESGLEILEAASAREVREVFALRNEVALLIADIVMGTECEGLELVRHVCEQLHNPSCNDVMRRLRSFQRT